jgi:hypothetical protein
VIHNTREHVRNRFHAPMWMLRKAGDVVLGIVRAEMVKKKKWIEIIQTSRCDCAPELDTCAVRCCFRLYDALNFSWCGHTDILAREGSDMFDTPI